MKARLFNIDQLHKSEEQVKKFFNKMQRQGMLISAHDEYYVCSRGTGKSEGLDARKLLQCVWAMPGSTGGLISPSYAKAWGNTLPAICKALREWGYYQNVHYYVGRKAPASAGFKDPLREPLRDAWSNCIHFWNGTVLVILSFAQGMSANSMSLDWLIAPEAKFLNYDKIKNEVNPANRGNSKDFGYSELHHSVLYSTDMPTSKMGRWILEKENEMDSKHINLIKNIYKELKEYESLPDQNEYVKRKVKELRFDLSIARRFQPPKIKEEGKDREYTVYYGEYDIFDNLEVVGKDYIWQMYRDSPALIWRTAFLNEKILKVSDGFYSALDDDLHFYIPQDPTGLTYEKFNLKHKESLTCLTDYDLDHYAPLHVAFDSNSAISSIAIGQVIGNELKTICSMFVKTPFKLQDLVDKVCKYYSLKAKREVVFYYDHTFIWTSGNNPDSYKDTIINTFQKHKWEVTDVYIGHQPPYEWRHLNIDKAMKGDPDFLYPTFNLLNNEYLKIAMEQAGVKMGKDGFEKDKSAEKLPDSPDNPDETKTHITDAWDTLFYGVNVRFTEPSESSGGVIFLGRAS